MQKTYDELIEIINKASYEYYVLDNPTITDQEYDDYYNELVNIENKYPEIKRVDSLDESANSNEDSCFLSLFGEEDYNQIIPYTPEYTYGYRVASINKDIHDYYYKITSDAEKEIEAKITKKINSRYKEVYDIVVDADAKDVFFNFTYVPVYVNTYTYKGKTYKTYISGINGKVVGDTPVCAKKIIKKILTGLAITAAVAALGYFLFLK